MVETIAESMASDSGYRYKLVQYDDKTRKMGMPLTSLHGREVIVE